MSQAPGNNSQSGAPSASAQGGGENPLQEFAQLFTQEKLQKLLSMSEEEKLQLAAQLAQQVPPPDVSALQELVAQAQQLSPENQSERGQANPQRGARPPAKDQKAQRRQASNNPIVGGGR